MWLSPGATVPWSNVATGAPSSARTTDTETAAGPDVDSAYVRVGCRTPSMNALRALTAVAIGPPDDFGVTGRSTRTTAFDGADETPSASVTATGPRTAPA